MELAPDISGVCRVAGTLLITSKPTSSASTKMVMSPTNPSVIHCPFVLRGRRPGTGVHDLAGMGDQHALLNLIRLVDGQLAVRDQVRDQRAGVAPERLRGAGGQPR